MKQRFFSLCLAGFGVAVFAFASFAVPTHAGQKGGEPKKGDPTLIVSAETLAQAVQDDVNAAAKKYHLTELQIDGVVTKHRETKGEVTMIQFDVMVKDRKKNKMVEFTIFIGLKDSVPKGDKRLDEIAVGKRVTARGKSVSMGNGQVTFLYCTIVREADKGGAKKESKSP